MGKPAQRALVNCGSRKCEIDIELAEPQAVDPREIKQKLRETPMPPWSTRIIPQLVNNIATEPRQKSRVRAFVAAHNKWLGTPGGCEVRSRFGDSRRGC